MIDHAKPEGGIPVSEAIATAKAYVQEVFSDTPIHDVMLEEVAKSEDQNYWLITIGFSRKEHKKTSADSLTEHMAGITSMSALMLRRDQLLERDYKLVKIDRHTGDVVEMRIRDLGESLQ